MSATLATPWYCAALRRASEWLAEAAQRLEAPALDGTDYVHRCDAAEERLREMRMRYY